MTDYTPTTQQVRALYDERTEPAEFDRGLAAHDAEVAAKALEEAADDLTPGDDKVDDWGIEAGLLRDRAAELRKAAEQ